MDELNNLGLSPEEIARIEDFAAETELESASGVLGISAEVSEQGEEIVTEPTEVESISAGPILKPVGIAAEVNEQGEEVIINDPSQEINEIFGTPGDDPNLRGTDFADLIFALEGNDRVFAGLGNDTIEAGLGNDNIAGEGGNDNIFGEEGDDLIFGDSFFNNNEFERFFGNDNIFGEDGRDLIFGSLGDDTLRGNFGEDVLDGGDGNDRLYGDKDNDVLNGANGNDRLYGGRNNDGLTGGEGNDLLNGNGGKDTISGQDGDDRIFGGSGKDYLFGDSEDSAIDSIGSDTIFGGSGNDTLDGGAESDSLDGGKGSDRLMGVEDFFDEFDYGADTKDTLTGGADSDTFVLGGKNENGEEVVYYDDGNPLEQGTGDYALITDFEFGDTFDAVGLASDYTFAASPEGEPSGIGIYLEQGEVDELVAIVQISFGLGSSSTANSKGLSSVDTPDSSVDSPDLFETNLNIIEDALV